MSVPPEEVILPGHHDTVVRVGPRVWGPGGPGRAGGNLNRVFPNPGVLVAPVGQTNPPGRGRGEVAFNKSNARLEKYFACLFNSNMLKLSHQ